MGRTIKAGRAGVGRRTTNTGVAWLAARTGASRSQISRVLSGKRGAGRDLARKLKRLGVVGDFNAAARRAIEEEHGMKRAARSARKEA